MISRPNRIIPHRPSTRKNGSLFKPKPGHHSDISEAFYAVGREMATEAYMAAQRACPLMKRTRDDKLESKYQAMYSEAKAHLSYYRTLVRDRLLPLAKLTKHSERYDFNSSDFELEAVERPNGDIDLLPKTRLYEDRPTYELRAFIVLNAFSELHRHLGSWGYGLRDEDTRDQYLDKLNASYHAGRERLLDFLSYYEADPVYTEDDNGKYQENEIFSKE